MQRFLGAAALSTLAMGGAAYAEGCGGYYVVTPGDSLSGIADRQYSNAGNWTAIHTANLPNIGENPNSIRVGQWLYLNCIDGLPKGLPASINVQASGSTLAQAKEISNQTSLTAATPAAAQPQQQVTRTSTDLLGTPDLPLIKLVTGDDFAPFTDRSLMGKGLIAEVVDNAMLASVGDDGFDTFWINDWASHTETLMPTGLMEMTFPWAKPDCDATPDQERCISYSYSDPMFEYLILLFVKRDNPIPFAVDADMEGRTLCRPSGYATFMLDKDDRNWLKDDKVTLVQPSKVSDCFTMLDEGKVEGVIVNEFTGRTAIANLGLRDEIKAVATKPVAITGLHVLVHNNNPNAQQLVDTINSGLRAIKDDGKYQEIVARHMETIWASF